MVHSRTACSKAPISRPPSARRKLIRLSEARLQAVSSRNMYSEQGLEALIRPLLGQVCPSLMVVSYCTPGSAQAQAAWAIFSHSARAFSTLLTLPSVRRVSFQSASASTAAMNELGTRTELLEFCPDT